MTKESKIIDLAKRYLLSFPEVSEDMITQHLNEWKNRIPSSIKGLFRAFLLHAQNRQGMPNSIGEIDKLSDILFGFDPVLTLKKYGTWDVLFDAIKNSDYSPPGRMEKENKKNYWVIYTKSIISIANFLSSFKNIEEFNKFVQGFYTNAYSRLALPLLLEKEIFGFGFALACDFLKETGYPEFIKPDTHIKDIALGIGITSESSDYQIFKDVILFCQKANALPYEVDKLFWLIGSGRFYLFNVKINSSKDSFIELIKSEGLIIR